MQFNPNVDISKELGEMEGTAAPVSKEFAGVRPAQRASSPQGGEELALYPPSPHGSDDFEPSDEESELHKQINENLRSMSIGSSTQRYFGKSSGTIFLRGTYKQKYSSGGRIPPLLGRTSGFPQRNNSKVNPIHPVRLSTYYKLCYLLRQFLPFRQWFTSSIEDQWPVFHDFPAEDLMELLIAAYFREQNAFMILLHEPTFRDGIKNGHHLVDGAFGAIVLLVCANGARWVRDPCTLLEEYHDPQSAGVKWFAPVERVRKSRMCAPTLHDLQICVVSLAPWMHEMWLLRIVRRPPAHGGVHSRQQCGAYLVGVS